MLVARYTSSSRPEVTYEVRTAAKASHKYQLTCNCPAWIYSKKDPATGMKRDCHHLIAFKSKQAEDAAAPAFML